MLHPHLISSFSNAKKSEICLTVGQWEEEKMKFGLYIMLCMGCFEEIIILEGLSTLVKIYLFVSGFDYRSEMITYFHFSHRHFLQHLLQF